MHNRHERHRIRVYRWMEGELIQQEFMAPTFDIAIAWLEERGYKTFKIFDKDNNLVHQRSDSDPGGYA